MGLYSRTGRRTGPPRRPRGLLVTAVSLTDQPIKPVLDPTAALRIILRIPSLRRFNPNGDGDIIVRIDNVKIDNIYDLRSYIMLNTSPGDEIVVEVLRDGETVPVSLTLGSWGDRFN